MVCYLQVPVTRWGVCSWSDRHSPALCILPARGPGLGTVMWAAGGPRAAPLLLEVRAHLPQGLS